jgi:hypothetical protein
MANTLFNKLPDEIKKLESMLQFEKELRSFLLQRKFDSVDEYMSY